MHRELPYTSSTNRSHCPPLRSRTARFFAFHAAELRYFAYRFSFFAFVAPRFAIGLVDLAIGFVFLSRYFFLLGRGFRGFIERLTAHPDFSSVREQLRFA